MLRAIYFSNPIDKQKTTTIDKHNMYYVPTLKVTKRKRNSKT